MFNREKNIKNKNIGQVLTKEYLSEAVKTKSNEQIALENDCSKSVVRKYLTKYNIKCFNTRKGKKPPTFIEGDWLRNGRYYVWSEDDHKRVRKNVYIMEQFLGRKINSKEESVHHLNGNPLDDRIENLVLMPKKEHDRFHLIIRNKNRKLDDTWTISKTLLFLCSCPTEEMKRYAELTRTINCKK